MVIVTEKALLAIMSAVKQICYGNSKTIPKTDRAWLRKQIRSVGYSLEQTKRIENEFYKNC